MEPGRGAEHAALQQQRALEQRAALADQDASEEVLAAKESPIAMGIVLQCLELAERKVRGITTMTKPRSRGDREQPTDAMRVDGSLDSLHSRCPAGLVTNGVIYNVITHQK